MIEYSLYNVRLVCHNCQRAEGTIRRLPRKVEAQIGCKECREFLTVETPSLAGVNARTANNNLRVSCWWYK